MVLELLAESEVHECEEENLSVEPPGTMLQVIQVVLAQELAVLRHTSISFMLIELRAVFLGIHTHGTEL